MATFALVPGAWHGTWCFERLVPELARRGHEAIAVELPSGDPEATLADYAACVAEALRGCEDELPIVVGHSLAGITIPLVPGLRPVAALVFLAAFVPRPGVSVAQEFAAGEYWFAPGGGEGRSTDDQGRSYWSDLDRAMELLFGDCEPAEARRAAARLTPQGQRGQEEPNPLRTWPNAPSFYIRSRDDRFFTAEFANRMARERLEVEPLEVAGGHSSFLSHPGELATVLDEIAART